MNPKHMDDGMIWLSSAFIAIAGLLTGLVVAYLNEFLDLYDWTTAIIGAVVVVIVLGFLKSSDILFDRVFKRVAKNMPQRPTEDLKPFPKKKEWIVFGLGVVLALIVTRFVPASTLLDTWYG